MFRLSNDVGDSGVRIDLKIYISIQFTANLYDFNILRPRQNGHHFPDDIFKCMFLNEDIWIWISIKFLLKLFSYGSN